MMIFFIWIPLYGLEDKREISCGGDTTIEVKIGIAHSGFAGSQPGFVPKCEQIYIGDIH